ncbi:hypothetical protein BOW53_07955 [Solemya pervernicosa gill symbiont]|uniref:Hemerythrin-like domain-containing protein n=1 Tax=Solemya pervernicosa gill symbiont TaxID=642797 RepID=A0A1T2L5R0_9GAMM|nr:bacteriohemerythrin [Solemya pervernicosa gill symbiont]OOZ40394.1 hypothetical protein BOW53_07955 [Solemya pervernicosa gill symbiont]
MAITWDDTYSVGIEEIDNQHKVLVGLINELDDALRVHSNREMVQGVIDQLIDYTKLHFAVEESIMRLFKYKEYEPHKAVHDGIIDKLNGMNEKFSGSRYFCGSLFSSFARALNYEYADGVDYRGLTAFASLSMAVSDGGGSFGGYRTALLPAGVAL